jgi:hypothetical protein
MERIVNLCTKILTTYDSVKEQCQSIRNYCKNYTEEKIEYPVINYDYKTDTMTYKYLYNNVEYVYVTKRSDINFTLCTKKIENILENQDKKETVENDDYFITATLNEKIDITNKLNRYAGPNGLHMEYSKIYLINILNDEEYIYFDNLEYIDNMCSEYKITDVEDYLKNDTETLEIDI